MRSNINVVFVTNIIVIITLVSLTNCQLESPCPNIFQYQYGIINGQNDLYGVIQVPLINDNSNVIKLEVQISVGNSVQGYNGNIQLGASRTEILSDIVNNRPLRYLLYFPRWANVPPRVTRIMLNRREICTGNSIDRTLVPIVTTIDLQHSLTIATSPNGLQTQDKWTPMTNSFLTPKPQTPPEGTSQFYFVLGSPSDNKQISNTFAKNPFFNQILTGEQQGMGGLFGNSQFGGQNSQFASTHFPFGAIPNTVNNNNNNNDNDNNHNNRKQIPDLPNKSGGESYGNVPIIPSKSAEPDNLPTVESNLVTQSSSDECGIAVNSNNLLVNGNRFTRGQHPWLAALFMQNDEGLKFICGTSVVSKRHVVTAAHCIRTRRKKFKPEELWVVLGRENIQKWSNDGAQIIQAESTHYHPDHQFHTADADIAIITLIEEVVFSPLVRPVCLWNSNPDESLIVGQNGTVVGWGKDEQGRVFTPEPRKVSMPVVSEETCLRSNSAFREITSNRTFCAGNRDATGPCNGDSGTGLLIQRFGRWYLRGVVSMSLLGSDGNCDLREYVVFTDAARYGDWIRSFLR